MHDQGGSVVEPVPTAGAALDLHRMVAERVSDVILLYAVDDTLLWASPALEGLLGHDPGRLVGTRTELVHPEDAAGLRERTEAVARSGSDHLRTRLRVLDAQGDTVWVDASVEVVRDAAGEHAWSLVVMRDLSEQVLAEETLAARERHYRMLADNASDVVVHTGPDGVILWVSPSVSELLGFGPDEVVGRRMSQLLHPDDLDGARRTQRSELDQGVEHGRVQVRVATRDHGWRWMSIRGRALTDESGAPAGGVDALRDIDSEVRARASLQTERERLRATLDSLIDPHVQLDAVRDDAGTVVDFTFADVNSAACTYNGMTREQLLGRRLLDLLPGHRPAGLFDLMVRVVETGEPLALDAYAYEPEPETPAPGWFDLRAVRVGDGISYTWRDVTGRVADQAALAASEARFRLLAENSSDVVFRGTADARISWVSPSVTEVLGLDPHDLVGRSSWELVHPDDRERVSALLEVGPGPVSTEVRTYEARFGTAGGDTRWMGVTVRPVVDDAGTVVGWVGSARDVDTEHRARETAQFLADHDPLTELLNRRAVLARLDAVLAHSPRTGGPVGVLYADLDGLKPVNDTLGHAAGDELLLEVVRRLAGAVRADDVVGRLGGDEFVVLLGAVDGWESARAVAEKLRATVAEPMTVAGARVRVSVSIGVALTRPGDEPDDVLNRADRALYRAKAAGGDRVEVDTED